MAKSKKKKEQEAANEEVNAVWMRIQSDENGRTEVMETDGGMLVRTIYLSPSETMPPAMAICFVPKKSKKK